MIECDRKGVNSMGLKQLKDTCAFLGPMYSVRVIDGVETIYRKVGDTLEFEVTGFLGTEAMTVNVWRRSPHIELMAIYTGITCEEDLADILGHLSFKYQNLQEKIQVEREDPLQ